MEAEKIKKNGDIFKAKKEVEKENKKGVAQHIKDDNHGLANSLSILNYGEADLIFSFGFEDDFRYILDKLAPIYQATLAFATFSENVTKLRRLVLNNPVVLN